MTNDLQFVIILIWIWVKLGYTMLKPIGPLCQALPVIFRLARVSGYWRIAFVCLCGVSENGGVPQNCHVKRPRMIGQQLFGFPILRQTHVYIYNIIFLKLMVCINIPSIGLIIGYPKIMYFDILVISYPRCILLDRGFYQHAYVYLDHTILHRSTC